MFLPTTRTELTVVPVPMSITIFAMPVRGILQGMALRTFPTVFGSPLMTAGYALPFGVSSLVGTKDFMPEVTKAREFLASFGHLGKFFRKVGVHRLLYAGVVGCQFGTFHFLNKWFQLFCDVFLSLSPALNAA